MKNPSTVKHAIRLYDRVYGTYRGQYMESFDTCLFSDPLRDRFPLSFGPSQIWLPLVRNSSMASYIPLDTLISTLAKLLHESWLFCGVFGARSLLSVVKIPESFVRFARLCSQPHTTLPNVVRAYLVSVRYHTHSRSTLVQIP